MRRLLRGRAAAALVTVACVGAGTLATTVAGPAAADDDGRPYDRTSPAEARRVDRVRLAPIAFGACDGAPAGPAQCASVRVPLDYDRPDGATITLPVVRVRATDPARRIGVLFVNPGGPGGSAVELASSAPDWLDPRLLARFDVVGVEPRGLGAGTRVGCFGSTAAAVEARAGRASAFPVGRAQERAWLGSARQIATGCSTTGLPLTASASTAEVARDMDVVRRALGEKRLTYLGFSYGTQLGQVYANLFPDRVRALVVDGVIDPVAWTTGRGEEARTRPTTFRIRSDVGASKALREFLARCDAAGPDVCSFAGPQPALDRYAALAERLRRAPVSLDVPQVGPVELDYATLVSVTLSALYGLSSPGIDGLLADVLTVADLLSTEASAPTGAAAAAVPAALARDAGRRYAALRDALRARWETAADPAYPNQEEVFLSVVCTDGLNPRDPQAWRRAGADADRRAPYFGRAWTWLSAECAGRHWTARDEDAYLGPFTRRTAAPLLVVGDYYDPATPYLDGAVPAARLAPNSRLLSSDSWGHTAYGTSACVTDAVVGYLEAGTLPAEGTVCVGYQPFETSAGKAAARSAAPQVRPGAVRPAPVRPALPDPFVG